MKDKLELVHFQITRGCNLRCWFCGQWGKQGFFRGDTGEEMTLEDWLRIAQELSSLKELPSIMLWGGEPLVSPDFEALANALHQMGFTLGMVTNGTLLHRHLDTCRRCFKRIYVSLDGAQDIHDAIRGEGVFQKVKENLQLLRGGNAKISINTVLTPRLMEALPEALDAFAQLGAEEVLLQEMIALSPEEIEQYTSWLQREFSQEAREIRSWEAQSTGDPLRQQKLAAILRGRQDLFRVVYKPHGAACGKHCTSPEHHVHVTWKGSVTFCTDFYDFSAGNVHEQPLTEIFENHISQRFREQIAKGACVTCDHCSWRSSEGFRL